MKKWLGIVTGILLLGVLAFYAFNAYIYREKQGDGMNTTHNPLSEDSLAQVTPISHASFILQLGGQTIYNDPVGASGLYSKHAAPAIILVSDIHGDHLDPETLIAVSTSNTTVVVPQAVKDQLPNTIPGTILVLANGEKITQKGIEIEAIPMYNVPESQDSRHPKGRGNGYVLSADGKRVYIAGDTAVTPEMKALTNIDIAFIPMNMPFTMTVEEASVGVLAFKPKVVHPYHYRGQTGLSDINKFKELVNAGNPSISVELLNFYPEE